MWFKGVLTSENLGTLIDSELLIYCLQTDYILSRIRVCITKMPFSTRFAPLLLSTVDATAHLSVVLLCVVDATPQPLDVLLWFVYMSPQLIINQLSSPQLGVDQSLELGGYHSKLHLLLAFGPPTPLVSVPVSMTRCSIVLITSHSGACSVLV
jgi:hypothetical protein